MKRLNQKELMVLELLSSGLTNEQIANELFLSPNTVKMYLKKIFEKLGVNNRVQAAVKAVSEHIMKDP